MLRQDNVSDVSNLPKGFWHKEAMIGRMGFWSRRAKEIFQTEGLLPLARRSLVFLVGHFFCYKHYYLYEHTIKKRKEAHFLPKTMDFTFEIVTTNQQADALVTSGLNFGSRHPNEKQGLEKKAVAFCFFIDGELAHIGCVGMSQEAKNSFDSLPYSVDFANKQACTGGTWTNPRYRGKGLMVYSYFKRLEFLKDKGFSSSRNAIDISNVASQKAHAKFKPKVYARARYLKILGRRYWRETPIKKSL